MTVWAAWFPGDGCLQYTAPNSGVMVENGDGVQNGRVYIRWNIALAHFMPPTTVIHLYTANYANNILSLISQFALLPVFA